jgi:hypothetical protein
LEIFVTGRHSLSTSATIRTAQSSNLPNPGTQKAVFQFPN